MGMAAFLELVDARTHALLDASVIGCTPRRGHMSHSQPPAEGIKQSIRCNLAG